MRLLPVRLPRRLQPVLLLALPAALGAQHAEHHHHAGAPAECRTLAAPPWSGLPAADRAAIARLQGAVAGLHRTDAASAAGFAPQFGDIPTMGVHWIHRARMQDAVRLDAPDHLLFTRIAGRDSLVGIAYAFRGPVQAAIPSLFESELAHWHDHPELGGGGGNTLHMLHVWFVPSPNGPFAGNNFFLALMGAGQALPDPCWIRTTAEVERLELVASLLDLLGRRADSMTTDGAGAPMATGAPGRRRAGQAAGARALLGTALADLAVRVAPPLAALDSAARRADREAWERAADATLATLRPVERRLLEGVRDRVKGIQASTADARRRPVQVRP
jgi:hypothetical protein